MATVEELETWIIDNADQKGSDDFNFMVQEYDNLLAQQGGASPSPDGQKVDPYEGMGFLDMIGESFTGNARETEATRTLPNYWRMPELNELGIDVIQTSPALYSAAPDEMAQIIKAQFPDVEVSQDEKGNYLLTSGVDGVQYAIKPGYGEGDTTRFVGQALSAVPAGFVTVGAAGAGLVGWPLALLAAGSYGLTQLSYQLYQKAVGGEFNTLDVALESAMPVGGQATKVGAKNVANAFKNFYTNMLHRYRPPTDIVEKPLLTDDKLKQLVNKAKDGDVGAQEELAELGKVDYEIIAAAEELGIAEYLQPDHVSTDMQFIELVGLIKSWSGSAARNQEIKSLGELSSKLVEGLHELGAQAPGDISEDVAYRLRSQIEELDNIADGLWDNVRGTIDNVQGARQRKGLPPLSYEPKALIGKILDQAEKTPGGIDGLPPYMKDFLNEFTPKEKIVDGKVVEIIAPRLEFFDSFRRSLTNGIKGKGRYLTEDESSLRKFYGEVLGEERNALRETLPVQTKENPLAFDPETKITPEYQVLDDFDLARQTSQFRFGLMEDQKSIFGSQVAKTLGGESLVTKLKTATKNLQIGDQSKFVTLIEAIPEDMRADAVLSGVQMMLSKNTKEGGLTAKTFSEWYRGVLSNKPTYDALKTYLPKETMATLDNVYKVTTGIARALDTRRYNGSSMQLTELLTTETFMSRVGEMAVEGGKAGLGELVLSTVIPPGMYTTARVVRSTVSQGAKPKVPAQTKAFQNADALLSSPAFLNMVRDGYSDQSINRFSNSSAWKNFAKVIGLEGDANETGSAFVRAIYQASSTAVAEGAFPQQAEEVQQLQTEQMNRGRMVRAEPPIQVPSRGVPGMGGATPGAAPAPSPTAQGPQVASQSSREMLKALFPMDTLLG